jgi:hypothetical protein
MANLATQTHQIEIILHDYTQWQRFIQQVEAQATDYNVWQLIDPSSVTQPALAIAPTRPTAPLAVAGLPPSADAINFYKTQQEDYRFNLHDYEKQQTTLITISKWVREHITLPNQDAVKGCSTLWQTLRKLQDRCKASPASTRLELKRQWNQLVTTDTRSQNWRMILDKLSIQYGLMVAERIVTFQTGQNSHLPDDQLYLIEALNLISHIDQIYADSKRSFLSDPTFYIQDVPQLITDFRSYMNTKPLTRAVSENTAFNTEQGPTLKGHPRGSKKMERTWPACACGAGKHRIFRCYYHLIAMNEAKGRVPTDFKANDDTLKNVRNLVKDAKVKEAFEADKAKCIAGEKKHGKQVSPSQNTAKNSTSEESEHYSYQTTYEDNANPIWPMQCTQTHRQTTQSEPLPSELAFGGWFQDLLPSESDSNTSLTRTTHGLTPNAHENDTETQASNSENHIKFEAFQTTEIGTSFSAASEPEPYYFTNAWVMDGGSERHICNSPHRNKYRKTRDASPQSYVRCGLTRYLIESYGTVTLEVLKPEGDTVNVDITDVALCPYFRTNLISTSKLELKGLHLVTIDGGYLCPSNDVTRKLFIPVKHKMYWCLEFKPPTHHEYAQDPREGSSYVTTDLTKPQKALEKLLTTTANEDKWHMRLGHPGPETMQHFAASVQGNVTVNYSPSTKNCEVCAVSKAHQVISRSPFKEIPSTRPFQRIHYDLIPMNEAYNGDRYISHFHCDYSLFRFVFTHKRKTDCTRCFAYVIALCKNIFHCTVEIFQTDGETSLGKETSEINAFWDTMRDQGIIVHQSAPHTQDQNGAAEVIGKHLIIQMRCNRIQSGQPENLWPEHAKATAVQENRKPVKRLSWKTPYEAVHNTKPVAFHLVAYGSKAYALNKQIPKLNRLDPRAFIGHLVGYEGTNIYRVWIPSQKKVIRTRDVVFNEEDCVYNPSEIDSLILYPEAVEQRLIIAPTPMLPDSDDLLEYISASDALPDEPAEVVKATATVTTKQIFEDEYDGVSNEDEDNITDFSTPSSSRGEVQYPALPEHLTPTPKKPTSKVPSPVQPTPSGAPRQSLRIRKKPNRFDPSDENTYHSFYISTSDDVTYGNAFLTLVNSTKSHRNDLPPPPFDYEAARKSSQWPHWYEACKEELGKMKQKGVFRIISYTKNMKPRPIPLKWVFSYKFDSSGYLIRHKARLCVRGDRQPLNGLDTYAATLASEVMRFLLALAAYFDLEMRQYDAVTAFLNADLDEVVHTSPPPGFGNAGEIWLLLMALYGLRRSPHLWHNEFSGFLQLIGLRPIPGVNCIHHNDWMIVFFFVDDIICLYRKQDQAKFDRFEASLSAKYELRKMGEPEHFLGIQLTRNRTTRTITICQKPYIEKISKRFENSLLNRRVHTPLPNEPLTPHHGQATAAQVKEMQEKVGSIGYASYITRWDVAFAASLLAEFQLNPSPEHLNAANHCLTYLRDTSHYAIAYCGDCREQQHHISNFIEVSTDASFADDVTTRMSRQGYLMSCAGGAVAWKANKQRTVTTSSTEAELLAASQVGKEVLWWKRLFNDLNFILNEVITIRCDNSQTIRLLTEPTVQLTTKLRHVDIHHHWLRQEIREKNLAIEYIKTSEQPSDLLTKPGTRQKQETFLRQGNMHTEA